MKNKVYEIAFSFNYVIKYLEHEKALELGEPESIPEPDEVRSARLELNALAKEKEQTEKLKANLEKELENAKDRAARLEEACIFQT